MVSRLIWMCSLIFIVALSGLCPQKAHAQGQVVVRIAPSVVEMPVEGVIDVAVEVVQVDKLYGFDISLSFDPQVVEVVDADSQQAGVQVSQGLFMDQGLTVINSADNSAGTIRFVMTQINPSLPKTGTGHLIVIRLLGKQAGASTLVQFPALQLAAHGGTEIPVLPEAGEVRVLASSTQPAPTFLPTQASGTLVPTLGLTPTAPPGLNPTAVAPTLTPSPTLSPARMTAVPSTPTHEGSDSQPTASAEAVLVIIPTEILPTHSPETQPALAVSEAVPTPIAAALEGPSGFGSLPSTTGLFIFGFCLLLAALAYIRVRYRSS